MRRGATWVWAPLHPSPCSHHQWHSTQGRIWRQLTLLRIHRGLGRLPVTQVLRQAPARQLVLFPHLQWAVPPLNYNLLCKFKGFPGSSAVKNPFAMQEMQEMRVGSPGQEDPLEEGMATRSSILAWKIPWTEEPGGLQSMGLHRIRHGWIDWACTHIHIQFVYIIPCPSLSSPHSQNPKQQSQMNHRAL